MPIAKEILNTFSIDIHFDGCHLSQQRSVPTDRQTLLMHQYILIEAIARLPSFCGYSPLKLHEGKHIALVQVVGACVVM